MSEITTTLSIRYHIELLEEATAACEDLRIVQQPCHLPA